MKAAEPSRFTRDRIAALVECALRESGALGILPTPLDAVTATAALELVEAPGLRPDVLGAIWFEERTLFVNAGQSGPRRRFTQAHEIVHTLCGWHYAALREDTEASLFGPARDAIEVEANAGAAMLIFQAGAFRERAAELPCTLASVRLLAKTFGASLHATLHHYVQSHPRPVAMLTVGRFPRKDATLPVWRRVESPSFHAASANALGSLSLGLVPGTRLRALVEDARTANGVTAVLGDGPLHLEAEAQYNRHSFLVLVRPAGSLAGSLRSAAA